MAKRKRLKTRKSSSISSRTLLSLTFIAAFLFFANIAFVFQKQSTTNSDYSLAREQTIEAKQNTVPQDVLAKAKEEKSVLGASVLHVPILMYHYVEYVQDSEDKKRMSLDTNPYVLEEEIKTLKDAGYNFITNAQLTSALNGNFKLPEKPILLTFDDSYRDFYTDAYPILKKYKARATQYVIAGFLDRNNHLLTSQLEEIAKDGLVEIGAHTVDHVWLKGQPTKTDDYEIAQSKKILEALIHKPVISFAYPFGAFDLQAVDEVKKAGFTSASSTVPGIDQQRTNKYFLYRLRPGGRTGKELLAWLDSVKNKE